MANHKSRLLDYIILLLCPLLISAQFWSVSFGGCTFYPDPSGALLRVGECPTENYYGNGLDLSSKSITSLPSDIFRGMAAVTIIRLNNNKIQVLPAGIFRDARSLRALYLNDNSIIILSSDVFQGLNSLESLDLCRNNISTLPEIIFKDPGFTLNSLLLYSNNITSLPEGIFQGFVTITNLDLHDNRLRTLPEGIFRGLRRLSSLSLYDNQITALPVGVFQGLPSLRSLEICGPLAGGTSPVVTADGKTVIYKGYVYKTLDETTPNASPYSYNNRGCQTSYAALPSGWSIAEENGDSKRVIGAFSWGTYCLAVANGNSYATSFGINNVWGWQANCGSGVIFTSGVSYVISECNYPKRILISRTLRANCTIPCIPLTSEQVAGMGDSYNGPETLCVICPKNSQAPQNSTTSNDCVCNTGYSGPGGAAGVCLACASGKYKSLTGTAACKDCDVGMYSAAESASACSLCPLGHYSNLAGAATCRPCATPTFTSVLGSTVCSTCPLLCPPASEKIVVVHVNQTVKVPVESIRIVEKIVEKRVSAEYTREICTKLFWTGDEREREGGGMGMGIIVGMVVVLLVEVTGVGVLKLLQMRRQRMQENGEGGGGGDKFESVIPGSSRPIQNPFSSGISGIAPASLPHDL